MTKKCDRAAAVCLMCICFALQDRDSSAPTQIYVGNLPRDNIDHDLLIEHFGLAGAIKDINMFPEKGYVRCILLWYQNREKPDGAWC